MMTGLLAVLVLAAAHATGLRSVSGLKAPSSDELACLQTILERHAERLPAGAMVDFNDEPVGTSPEAFSVTSRRERIVISGSTRRARVYGLGRLLREPRFRGESTPAMSVRGICFATHFGNWYDNAPEQEVRDYVQDLALWGCNQVRVWFDMHEFTGVTDPRAVPKVRRLRGILRAAADCGLKLSLMTLANEAFAGSPEEFRADWRGGQNGYDQELSGHYHVELCPSKPGGLERILAQRAEVLDLFADLPIAHVAVFPYDPGGCTCAGCAPWGVNGLFKILPEFSKLVEGRLHGCRLELSTWRFDAFGRLGEWDSIFAKGEKLREYVDSLSIERVELIGKGTPGELPASSMCEISRHGMVPWGGFGANPQPRRLAAEIARGHSSLVGFRPYSEGIYEDLNKVFLLYLEWKPTASPNEALGAYAAYYFGDAVRSAVVEAAALLEENLGHRVICIQDGLRHLADTWNRLDIRRPYELQFEGKRPDLPKARRVELLLNDAETALSVRARDSWRWRILRLRARIDRLLAEGAELSAEELATAFAELAEIYHVNAQTEPCLVPLKYSHLSSLRHVLRAF